MPQTPNGADNQTKLIERLETTLDFLIPDNLSITTSQLSQISGTNGMPNPLIFSHKFNIVDVYFFNK